MDLLASLPILCVMMVQGLVSTTFVAKTLLSLHHVGHFIISHICHGQVSHKHKRAQDVLLREAQASHADTLVHMSCKCHTSP